MTDDETIATEDASSAARRAYVDIVERLATGEFAPGSWLRERSLAMSMGVSRTPVREALNKLSSEGLVRLERNRGAQVVAWSREQIIEIYGLRAITEGYVASLAAQKADDSILAKLESNLSEYERAITEDDSTRQRAAALNNEFHRLILDATRNDSLIYLLNGVFGLPLVRRTYLRYTERDLWRSVGHHRELIDALRAHDGETAEMIMKVHIRTAQRAVLQYEQLEAEPPAT
ncbi:GntR family transcriptional regulator [Pseudonocardia sp. CA-142604]|uniref:GntR family transcriptional regulator n=1 Tax=Pseudonocardia sp. CA-142604 TaxID=3240024 RepID=UPI003D8F0B58